MRCVNVTVSEPAAASLRAMCRFDVFLDSICQWSNRSPHQIDRLR
jgi:hypothetical protein